MVENKINKLAIVKRGNSDFSLLHLNCRSLLGYFDDFKALIANLYESFCAIGISETWLNDQTFDLVNLLAIVSFPIIAQVKLEVE